MVVSSEIGCRARELRGHRAHCISLCSKVTQRIPKSLPNYSRGDADTNDGREMIADDLQLRMMMSDHKRSADADDGPGAHDVDDEIVDDGLV